MLASQSTSQATVYRGIKIGLDLKSTIKARHSYKTHATQALQVRRSYVLLKKRGVCRSRNTFTMNLLPAISWKFIYSTSLFFFTSVQMKKSLQWLKNTYSFIYRRCLVSSFCSLVYTHHDRIVVLSSYKTIEARAQTHVKTLQPTSKSSELNLLLKKRRLHRFVIWCYQWQSQQNRYISKLNFKHIKNIHIVTIID